MSKAKIVSNMGKGAYKVKIERLGLDGKEYIEQVISSAVLDDKLEIGATVGIIEDRIPNGSNRFINHPAPYIQKRDGRLKKQSALSSEAWIYAMLAAPGKMRNNPRYKEAVISYIAPNKMSGTARVVNKDSFGNFPYGLSVFDIAPFDRGNLVSFADKAVGSTVIIDFLSSKKGELKRAMIKAPLPPPPSEPPTEEGRWEYIGPCSIEASVRWDDFESGDYFRDLRPYRDSLDIWSSITDSVLREIPGSELKGEVVFTWPNGRRSINKEARPNYNLYNLYAKSSSDLVNESIEDGSAQWGGQFSGNTGGKRVLYTIPRSINPDYNFYVYFDTYTKHGDQNQISFAKSLLNGIFDNLAGNSAHWFPAVESSQSEEQKKRYGQYKIMQSSQEGLNVSANLYGFVRQGLRLKTEEEKE